MFNNYTHSLEICWKNVSFFLKSNYRNSQCWAYEKGKYFLSVNFCNLCIWSGLVTIDDNDQEIKEGFQALFNNIWQTRGAPEMFRFMLFKNHMDTSIICIPLLSCYEYKLNLNFFLYWHIVKKGWTQFIVWLRIMLCGYLNLKKNSKLW